MLSKGTRIYTQEKKWTNKCIYFHGVPLSAAKLLIKSRREATGYFVHMHLVHI